MIYIFLLCLCKFNVQHGIRDKAFPNVKLTEKKNKERKKKGKKDRKK